MYYNIVSISDLTCEVTSGDSKYTGDVKIPSTVTYSGRTLTVTGIKSSAYSGCSGLTSVEIPNSVTSIGANTFRSCSSLSSVSIPNSVTSIGGRTFEGCSNLKELVIEDGTTTLELGYNSSTDNEGLFYDCALESLYLGRNLTYKEESKYGYSPFCNVTTLKDVTIGNTVTSIGTNAFKGCSGLETISSLNVTPPSNADNAGFSNANYILM